MNPRRDTRSVVLLVLALVFTLSAWMCFANDAVPAHAAPKTVITVNTSADDNTVNGNCTLREAIIAANTHAAVDSCATGVSGLDTINFGISGVITLANNLPSVIEDLTINGPAGGITINGAGANRSGFSITANAQVSLSGLAFANGNPASSYGGAIIIDPGVTLNISGSIFTNNVGYYGGAIASPSSTTSTISITNSTFYSNSATYSSGGLGGAIYVSGSALSINGSTFFSNAVTGDPCCAGGGAIFVYTATAAITNSTFTGNSSVGVGGAIETFGFTQLTIANSTLANNSAGCCGGAITRNGGVITLTNSIVAFNIASTNPSTGNCSGAIMNGGYNIDSGAGCGWGSNLNSMSNTDPKLAPLGNYGGPTKTYGLFVGSPAIDQIPNGTNGCGTPINQDQRGYPRPQNILCDVGAFEGTLHGIYLPLIVR
jgi:CSLREA domain-containing protein